MSKDTIEDGMLQIAQDKLQLERDVTGLEGKATNSVLFYRESSLWLPEVISQRWLPTTVLGHVSVEFCLAYRDKSQNLVPLRRAESSWHTVTPPRKHLESQ